MREAAASRSLTGPLSRRVPLHLGAEPVIVVALGAALSALLFARLLVGTKVYASNDLVDLEFPFRAFINRALASHQFPLWTPDVWMGVPFLANNDAGLLYPFSLPYFLRPADLAVGWVLWLHTTLSVCTMYAYARLGLRLHPVAAFGAGFVFAFNGYALAHTGLAWSAYEQPWLPLLFLALHRAIEGRLAWAWLGPPAVALAVLGGQSQYLLWAGIWLVPYAGMLVLLAPSWGRALRAAATGALCAIGGGLLAAVQLLPEVELLANGVRLGQGLSFADATFAPLPAMPPWRLLLPDSTYVGEGAAWIGLVATALALFGMVMAFQRRERRALVVFFVIMAAACYVLALGAQTPLYHLAFAVLPGMHQLRLPVRWLYPMTIAMCPLAGVGLHELRASLRAVAATPASTGLVVGGAALCVVLAAGTLPHSSPLHGVLVRWEQGRWLHVASLLALLVGAAAIAANLVRRVPASTALATVMLAMVFELFTAAQFMEFNHPVSADYVTPRPILAYVASHGPGRALDLTASKWWDHPDTGGADANLLAGVQSVTGLSSSWPTLREGQLNSGLVPRLRADPAQALRSLDLLRSLGVRYLVTNNGVTTFEHSPELIRRVQDASFVLWELAQPGARDWTTCGASFVPDANQALAAVTAPTFTSGELYVEGAGTSALGSACGSATIVGDQLNTVTIEADMPASGWLVLADTWYPGWHATVDGHEVDIRHANYFGRAVALPAGQHTVRFEYRPLSFYVGLGVTLASLAALLALAIVQLARASSRRCRTAGQPYSRST